MPKEMEYKNFTFKIEKQAEEDGFLTFSGYASTFGNVDTDGDTFLPGAFAESISEETPKMLLMHDARSVPIGVWVELREDPIGLFVEGKMPLDDDRVKGMVAPQMKIGSLNAMSVGFNNAVYEYDSENRDRWGDPGRRFSKVTLKEISLVTFPANDKARITAVKDMLSGFDKKELKDILSDIFKEENEFEFPIFKNIANIGMDFGEGEKTFLFKNVLPIAETIDDEPVLIPKAVVSARAQIEKDCIEIKLSESEFVKKAISKYYEALGFDQPFMEKGSKWTLPEIKLLGKSDLEFVIRSGRLSRKSSDHIASVFLATQVEDGNAHTEKDVDLSGLMDTLNSTLKKEN